MKYRFADGELKQLYEETHRKGKYSEAVVKAFRRRMQLIKDARDERDIRAMKSLRFEKLKGQRSGEFSIRLNQQWRLILKFETASEEKRVIVISIEDYR